MDHLKEQPKHDRDLNDEIEAIKADLAALRTDLKSGAHSLFVQGKERVRALKDTVVDAAHQGTDSSRAYIQENPFKTVGIALGVGVLTGAVVGFLLRRK
jgi:ElaB/YqjD/DUF883 family membrane-anchored ribosome-binding protein